MFLAPSARGVSADSLRQAMTSDKKIQEIIKYVENQIACIHKSPSMFGSLEAIELQFIQLIEIWAVAHNPVVMIKNEKYVLEKYEQFRVVSNYPIKLPLSSYVHNEQELLSILHEFFKSIISQWDYVASDWNSGQ